MSLFTEYEVVINLFDGQIFDIVKAISPPVKALAFYAGRLISETMKLIESIFMSLGNLRLWLACMAG